MNTTELINKIKSLEGDERKRVLNSINFNADDFCNMETILKFDINRNLASTRYQPCQVLITKDDKIETIQGVVTGLARGKEFSPGELTVVTIDKSGNAVDIKAHPKDVHRISWNNFVFPKVKRNNILKVFLHNDKYYIVLERKNKKMDTKEAIAVFRLFSLSTANNENVDDLEFIDAPASTFNQKFFPIDDNPNDIKDFMFSRDETPSVFQGLLTSI